ncbi:MAG: glycoside hydrolase family 38 C-terminal domain-containing protein [Clostridia bacterium]
MSEKKVYTVATAHLDTIWNWDFEHTIDVCLKNTLERNFKLFEKYKDYNFNFEGSYRYELMEEYYPKEFEIMKKYVAEGRWNVAGSSFENGDVNIPSPEALFRNILFGNEYFAKTFGKRSKDIFLPDCFGFGYALPSIAAHSNLLGFSTQKLAWGSAYGTPFDIGIWRGVNGKSVFASFNPHDYTYSFKKIRDWDFVQKKLAENEKYDLNLTSVYHGVGDQGGAVEEKSVIVMENEMAQNDKENIKILSTSSDQLFKDLECMKNQKLPVWDNELIMQNHAVGGYTSRAIGKRWNRKAEELADMAERASVFAMLNGREYPSVALEKAWKRAIAHEFHDDITGTSVQRAYKRSWNDLAVSINQFNGEFEAASSFVIDKMDTNKVCGVPLVVANSLEFERNDIVNCKIDIENGKDIAIFDNGKEVPFQINGKCGATADISFVANVKPLSYKVFDLQYVKANNVKTALKATKNSLENERYIVKLNVNGEVCSIFDKQLGRELLEKPVTFDLFKYDGSKHWPAWELNYSETNMVSELHPKLQSIEIVENGNAKVALKVVQTFEQSTFNTIITLTNGGKVVEFDVEIMWNSLRTLLKNTFSFTASNKFATFDLGLGAIKRANASEKLFEVPAQKWVDLTDKSTEFGVAVFSECKYGWDKWNDNTLRLTLIHTPNRNYRKDSMQSFMDLGLNKFRFGITSHKGETLDEVQNGAREFLQPLTCFQTEKHAGNLQSEISLCEISDNSVIIRAIKKAENSSEIVARFNEGSGRKRSNVTFKLGEAIVSAREVFASEEEIGTAKVENGKLTFDIDGYDVKTFALTIKKQENNCVQKQVKLPFNSSILTKNDSEKANTLGKKAFSLPLEIFPEEMYSNGVKFKLGEKSESEKNALIGNGQELKIEKGYKKINLLAGSLNGDKNFEFLLDGKVETKYIQEVDQKIGGWDLYNLNESAFVKDGKIAWEFTHTHTNGKNDTARQVYFYNIELNIQNATTLTLPKDEDFCMLSATYDATANCELKTRLIDKVSKRKIEFKMSNKQKLNYAWRKISANWHI